MLIPPSTLMYLTRRYSGNAFSAPILCVVVLFLSFILIPFLAIKEVPLSMELKKIEEFISDDLSIIIPIHVRFGDKGFIFPDIIEAAQLELDYELQHVLDIKWRFKLINELECDQIPIDNDEGKYILELNHSDDNFVILESDFPKIRMYYTQASIHANDLPFFMAQAILDHLMSPEIEMQKISEVPMSILDNQNISVRIIIFGKRSKHYARTFEETLDSEFGSFNQEISTISNISLTVTSVENFEYEEINNLMQNPKSLSYFYHGTEETENFNNKTLGAHNITTISNEIRSTQDVALFLSQIRNDMEALLGMPKNPSNNVKMRVSALKRYITLKRLTRGIDHWILELARNRNNTEAVKRSIEFAYQIIDNLHRNESEHDWNRLLPLSTQFMKGEVINY